MVRPFGINLEKAGHLLYMMRSSSFTTSACF
ncbi:hypothetical protein ACVIKP_006462 [Rhizobium leguminosarum]